MAKKTVKKKKVEVSEREIQLEEFYQRIRTNTTLARQQQLNQTRINELSDLLDVKDG